MGGARGRVPEGVTGSGAPSDYPGELQANESVQRAPGSGLDGGLGAPERATAAASGRT
ncbi:hypothetical protein H8N03_21005 [Ramlibacter sp. USB13]|uniref:Uncharacterized protein n=1 Tax=Ramlibacter cellulosilyticus TaxID=2764187 RepID=A0A923SCY6_9BURK|nr:hypothetical protein [Ramlibacter cellulosilyticus]MBC5785440.1 hypothetical protein [Ramlibacter cellulosilyticus]